MADILAALGTMAMGTRLKRAGTRLQAETHVWMQQTGCDCPASHMPLLASIHELGRAPLGTIAESMGVAQPGVSRMVRDLEAKGWVTSEPDPNDGRVRLLSLSAAGEDFIRRAHDFWWPIVAQTVGEICDDLGGSFSEQLSGLEEEISNGNYRRALERHAAARTVSDECA